MKYLIHINNYAAFRHFNYIERYRIRRVLNAFAELGKEDAYYRNALQDFYMAPTQRSFAMCLWLLRTYDLWLRSRVTGCTLVHMVELVEQQNRKSVATPMWKVASNQQ